MIEITDFRDLERNYRNIEKAWIYLEGEFKLEVVNFKPVVDEGKVYYPNSKVTLYRWDRTHKQFNEHKSQRHGIRRNWVVRYIEGYYKEIKGRNNYSYLNFKLPDEIREVFK